MRQPSKPDAMPDGLMFASVFVLLLFISVGVRLPDIGSARFLAIYWRFSAEMSR
jgi:hypothetical protein